MTADTAAASPAAEADGVQHRRATVRPDKAESVAELVEAFRSSSAAVLTEYRGLSVKQLTALRVALGADTTYAIVKNTLTRLAASEAGLQGMDALLSGPTAVAFVKGDPVEAAKGLREFGRTNPALVVKGGVLDGRPLSADEVRRLADLESREVLLGRLAGAFLASLSQAVYLLNAPLQQVARLAGALQAKAEEDPSVLAGTATAASPSSAEGGPADASGTGSVLEASADAPAQPDAGTPDAAGPGAAGGNAAGGEGAHSVAADVAEAGVPERGPVPGAGDGTAAQA